MVGNVYKMSATEEKKIDNMKHERFPVTAVHHQVYLLYRLSLYTRIVPKRAQRKETQMKGSKSSSPLLWQNTQINQKKSNTATQLYCHKNSRDREEQRAEMSFILWTGSLNIWHRCMRLKGHCVALLSGASLGLNNRTAACWLGCQQSCLRWDAPCLSWSGVPPEMLRLSLKPGKEGALRRCNVCTVGRLWLQNRTATLRSNAAWWNRPVAKKSSLENQIETLKWKLLSSQRGSYFWPLAKIWNRKSVWKLRRVLKADILSISFTIHSYFLFQIGYTSTYNHWSFVLDRCWVS